MSLSEDQCHHVIASLTEAFRGVALFGMEKQVNGGFKLVIDSAPTKIRPPILEAAAKVLGRVLEPEEVTYSNGPIVF